MESKETPPPGVWAVSSVSLTIVSIMLFWLPTLSILIHGPVLETSLLAPMVSMPAAVGLGVVAIVLRERGAVFAFCVPSLSGGIHAVILFVLMFWALGAV